MLVATVSASEDEIVRSTGMSRDDVRAALASLGDRGLVDRLPETPTRFVAAPPSMVEALVSDRLAELRQAQRALDGLASQYRTASLARSADGVFEVIRGQPALRCCSISLLRSARSEVLNFVKPPLIAVQPEEHIGPADSVRNRIVYETCALTQPGMIEALQAGFLADDQARVHAKLPIKMLAVDGSAALLPLAQHDTTPIGVLVRESAVLDAILALFELVWATAIPLHLDGAVDGASNTSVLSSKDRELLSLLLAGLSDEAIAMHKKTSVRTVQRKVHALMDVANVRTRMQLAWQAAHRGWLVDADVELEDGATASSGNGAAPRA
jgi:DNA-binding CsgD family transcriptional regulator